jgi:hypothetical protein
MNTCFARQIGMAGLAWFASVMTACAVTVVQREIVIHRPTQLETNLFSALYHRLPPSRGGQPDQTAAPVVTTPLSRWFAPMTNAFPGLERVESSERGLRLTGQPESVAKAAAMVTSLDRDYHIARVRFGFNLRPDAKDARFMNTNCVILRLDEAARERSIAWHPAVRIGNGGEALHGAPGPGALWFPEEVREGRKVKARPYAGARPNRGLDGRMEIFVTGAMADGEPVDFHRPLPALPVGTLVRTNECVLMLVTYRDAAPALIAVEFLGEEIVTDAR